MISFVFVVSAKVIHLYVNMAENRKIRLNWQVMRVIPLACSFEFFIQLS